jgi:hypothetical protein
MKILVETDTKAVRKEQFTELKKKNLLFKFLNYQRKCKERSPLGLTEPEELSRILDTYEVLPDLLPTIDALYSDEAGSSIRKECHEVLRRRVGRVGLEV